MNQAKLDIQKILHQWDLEPSLRDIDVSQLSEKEKAELSKQLDVLEAFALKIRERLED